MCVTRDVTRRVRVGHVNLELNKTSTFANERKYERLCGRIVLRMPSDSK